MRTAPWLVLVVAHAAQVTWRDDALRVAVRSRTNTSVDLLNNASRPVLASSGGGHYRLELFGELTRCLEYATSEMEVQSALLALDVGWGETTNGWIGLTDVRVHRLSHRHGGWTFVINFSGLNTTVARATRNISVASGWCEPPVTEGRWGAASNWDTGAVPGAGDTVVIPWDSGRVVLDDAYAIGSLEMHGGQLVTANTSCPAGWSARPTRKPRVYQQYDTPRYDPNTECFRAFD